MPEAVDGLITATSGVLDGTILYYFLKAFVDSGLLPSTWLVVYDVANLLGILYFVHVTRYWGTLYLFMWWLGLGIMGYAGFVGGSEFAIDSLVLVFVLISRLFRRFD